MWDRLLGCFGDSLLRKFGKAPPQEWVGAIAALNDGHIERGLKRLLFGGKGQPPSLPEFVRVCRAVGTDEFDEDRPIALPAPDHFRGDAWDMAANRYLLGHIARQLSLNPQRYAGPKFVENVHRLVAAKNEWASDMRDIAVDDGVPAETQQAIWHDLIGHAEARLGE